MSKRRMPKDARYAPNDNVFRVWMRRYGKRRIRRVERRENKDQLRKNDGTTTID